MYRPLSRLSAVLLCLAVASAAAAQSRPSEASGAAAGDAEALKRIHAPIEVTVLPQPAGG